MLRMMIVCGAWAASGLAWAAALCGAAACWPERAAAAARWTGAVVVPALGVVLAGLVVLSLVAVAVWPDDPDWEGMGLGDEGGSGGDAP
jgi:hypothetical protein